MNPFTKGKGEEEAEVTDNPPLMPADNAPDVPAFQEDTGAQDGVLHEQLRAEGLVDQPYTDEQASKEAEAAASEKNARQAAKDSRFPHLIPGTRIQVSEDAEQHRNRVGHVERVLWSSQQDEVLAGLGTPESRFAQAEAYDIRFRDGVGGSAQIPANLVNQVSEGNFRRGTT